MRPAAKLLFKVFWGVLISIGVISSGIAIRNQNIANRKREARSWFEKTSLNDHTREKLTITNYNDTTAWRRRHESARYSYGKENLDYITKGWKAYRRFCYDGLIDLIEKGWVPADVPHPKFREEWMKNWKHWNSCIDIQPKFAYEDIIHKIKQQNL